MDSVISNQHCVIEFINVNLVAFSRNIVAIAHRGRV